MIELARGGMGWKDALAATQEPGMVRYVTDPGGPSFLDLLPSEPAERHPRDRPRHGPVHRAAGRRAAVSVNALEVVPEQAEFVAVRTRQEGFGNVSVAIGGDDCRLPYRDGAFDGIVLNLVFEWCGSRIAVGIPRAGADPPARGDGAGPQAGRLSLSRHQESVRPAPADRRSGRAHVRPAVRQRPAAAARRLAAEAKGPRSADGEAVFARCLEGEAAARRAWAR